jgi:tetratricopeptide (TPR) repeat protein
MAAATNLRPVRRGGLIALVAILSASAAVAADRCVLKSFAELPVTMEGLRPMVTVKINGVDAPFVADSGAFFSMLSPAAAAEFKLPTRPVRVQVTGSLLGFGSPDFSVRGIGGGSTTPRVATVQTLTLAQYPIHRVDFLVGGTDVGGGSVGLLGENLIRIADVEYDLAHGVLRFIKPDRCGSRPLAYWATPSQPIGVVDLDDPTAVHPQPIGSASVNGIKIRVGFDTGSQVSVLSLPAARRAGVTPDTPGVQPAGTMLGIGRNATKVWVAPIASFEIGGEEIKHTRLLIGDLKLGESQDMLLGDDFFLAHRIYVANSQSKLYFTYNGGAVFRLESTPPLQSAQSPPPGVGTTPSAGASQSAPGSEGPPLDRAAAGSAAPSPPADALGHFADQPTDAAGFMRRGTAYAARRDFKDALADLQHACELAPQEPDYFFELGRVEWQSGQRDQAIDSFNKTLKLKPDHVSALLALAQLTHSEDDLNTVDRLLPPEDGFRLQMGALYEQNGAPDAAIHQFDLWIRYHGEDGRLPGVLNSRCRLLAQTDQNLDQALKDCNAALHLQPHTAAFLDSRGLVQLRRGQLDRAIADYDAALALRPGVPTSLYGRGLAKLRKGLQAEGHADLAAASMAQPRIAERFARWGLTP